MLPTDLDRSPLILTSRTACLLTVGVVLPLLAACGNDEAAGTSSGTSVAVTASEDACELDRTDLEAGQMTFTVTNDGSSVTEVYVYGEQDGAYTRVISEVENIGPGTSRDMEVDLAGGTYEVACKPGQTGDGIRTQITVSGGDATAPEESQGESGYDREIELATDGTTITGLDGDAEVGERIEFKLTNNADDPRILEIKDPTGAVAAEVEVAVRETGETIVELDQAGVWQVIVEGDGVDDLVSELTVA
ncbi:MAG: cupredoxin domain-containing protein [Actinomycetota bacterium]|nr:cupredoxin domain-containing protein [Actinomycetota bacterium]